MKPKLHEDREAINGELVRDIQKTLRDANWNLNDLPKFLKTIIELEAWKRRKLPDPLPGENCVEFNSFAEFVTTPLLKGLGTTVEHLKNICRDDIQALDLIDQSIQKPHGGNHTNPKKSKSDNITLARGTSRDGALRRLRDQRPDLHKKVLKKELSAHNAMLKAGFRKKTITIPIDPERAAETIKKHFTETQVVQLIAYLTQEVD